MNQNPIAPQDHLNFPGRPQGYVVRIGKQQWNHPVRFVAKDTRNVIIAAGTVQQGVPFREFLVHPNTGFTVLNVGEWTLVAQWP
jgi:hypothetical protein